MATLDEPKMLCFTIEDILGEALRRLPFLLLKNNNLHLHADSQTWIILCAK